VNKSQRVNKSAHAHACRHGSSLHLGGGSSLAAAAAASTFRNKNRRHIGKSQSQRPPKRTQRPPHRAPAAAILVPSPPPPAAMTRPCSLASVSSSAGRCPTPASPTPASPTPVGTPAFNPCPGRRRRSPCCVQPVAARTAAHAAKCNPARSGRGNVPNVQHGVCVFVCFACLFLGGCFHSLTRGRGGEGGGQSYAPTRTRTWR
jgi:hypothetical protein